MPSIILDNVTVDIPIFGRTGRSIRSSLISNATGGLILKDDYEIPIVRALNNVSFTLKDGDRVGLIGSNGAGKTTLLRTISGIYSPTFGKLEVKGSIHPILSTSAGLDSDLSGEENIIRISLLNGVSYEKIVESKHSIIEFSGLKEFILLPVRTYSSGMAMRLLFSTLVHSNAEILVLDEFFSTGDDEFKLKAKNKFQEMLDASNLLVFASHQKELIKLYCNRYIKMQNGSAVEISNDEF